MVTVCQHKQIVCKTMSHYTGDRKAVVLTTSPSGLKTKKTVISGSGKSTAIKETGTVSLKQKWTS